MMEIAIRSLRRAHPPRGFSPLAALGREAPAAASRFRRWRGASGRGYLVSVYPIAECPDYTDAVLIAVDPAGACIWIGEAGGGGAGLCAVLAALAKAGASEIHVHLLAGDRASRAAAIRDLDGRH